MYSYLIETKGLKMPVFKMNDYIRIEATNYDDTFLIESTFGDIMPDSILVKRDDLLPLSIYLRQVLDFLENNQGEDEYNITPEPNEILGDDEDG